MSESENPSVPSEAPDPFESQKLPMKALFTDGDRPHTPEGGEVASRSGDRAGPSASASASMADETTESNSGSLIPSSMVCPEVAPKVPEKKIGSLLAAAMKKYAVPKSSSYHGVTKLKWSGKFEAHLWDNTSQVEGRKRKGKHGNDCWLALT